ncbi:MAG: 7-carboxy-7-deazaguanine synthase QueE, partial [Methanosarcinales archaeon]|nr:7-carboxy-7-deazaguanine synthase QueE [Methanosarcinales archaeon]
MDARSSTTHIYEIFNSIQGEGPYVGMRQVFVRFCGCNLACEYCDTYESRKDVISNCSVEKVPGSRIFSKIENP